MSICWYCTWGWSAPVAAIYDRYAAIADEWAMEYGPAHVVWCDENFARPHVEACLQACDAGPQPDLSPEQLAAVRQSLVDLLQLPDAVLDPQPADYDGEHPDRFPPQVPMARPGHWRPAENSNS